MQNFELLLEIIRGESQILDFKQRISNPRKIAKTMAAFANTQGGSLLIGVKDDKTIVGIDPYEEIYQIKEAATKYCDPPVVFQEEAIDVQCENGIDHVILRIDIPLSPARPHKAMNQNGEWVAYVRNKDKSLIAGKQTEKLMKNGQFEPQTLPNLEKHEQILVDFLNKYERIEIKQYMKAANISERRAKRSLQGLVKKGVLLKNEFNKRDFYSLSFT
jgi:predicted HTH transcriptional regulator